MSEIPTLSQEEMDCVILDAREGDLDTLREIFTELSPSLLLSIKDDVTLSTPLHMAAANGHSAVVKYLLSIVDAEDAQKLASQANETGNTPLHWAAYAGHLDIVRLLVDEYKVDPFVKNSMGHDAIYEAENNGRDDIEQWFLRKYSIEDDYNKDLKVEEGANGDAKITYTPGTVSREADEAAQSHTEELEKKTQGLELGDAHN
ncbi:Uncharacterized protein ABC855_g1137 [[Candida] zeylanoides]